MIDKFQKVPNCSYRLILKTSKRTHVSLLLTKPLPIAQRIHHTISSTCYAVVSKASPPYSPGRLHITSSPVYCVPLLTPVLPGFRYVWKSSSFFVVVFFRFELVSWNKLRTLYHAPTQIPVQTDINTTRSLSTHELLNSLCTNPLILFWAHEKCESMTVMISVRPAGRESLCGINFNVAIFPDTINMVNIKLCMMVVLI